MAIRSEIVIDTKKAKKELEDFRNFFKATFDGLKNLPTPIPDGSDSARKTESAWRKATTEINAVNRDMRAGFQSLYLDFRKAVAGGGDMEQAAKTLRAEVDRLSSQGLADVEKLTKEFGEGLPRAVRQAAQAAENAAKSFDVRTTEVSTGKTLLRQRIGQGIGDQLLNFTPGGQAAQTFQQITGASTSAAVAFGAAAAGAVAIAAGIKEAVGSAISLESALVDLDKTADFSAQGTFPKYKSGLEDLSNELGRSQEKLIGFSKDLASGGVNNAEENLIFTKYAAVLQSVGDGVDNAGDSLSKSRAQWDLTSESVGNFVAQINYAEDNIGGTAGQLLALNERVGATARTARFTSEGFQALNGSMLKAGGTVEVMGTAFAASSNKIIGGTALVNQFLPKIGNEFERLRKTNPEQAFLLLGQAINELPDPEAKIKAIQGIFDTKDVTMTDYWLKLAKGAEDYRQGLAGIRSETVSVDSVMGAFSKKQETLSGQWELFSTQAQNLGIHLGNALLPSLTALLKGVNDLITGIPKLGNEFESLKARSEETGKAMAENNAEMGRLTSVEGLIAKYESLHQTLGDGVYQNEEYKRVVGQLAAQFPEYISQFDKAGAPIAVYTSSLQDAINAQKELLKLQNADLLRQTADQFKESQTQAQNFARAAEEVAAKIRELRKDAGGSTNKVEYGGGFSSADSYTSTVAVKNIDLIKQYQAQLSELNTKKAESASRADVLAKKIGALYTGDDKARVDQFKVDLNLTNREAYNLLGTLQRLEAQRLTPKTVTVNTVQTTTTQPNASSSPTPTPNPASSGRGNTKAGGLDPIDAFLAQNVQGAVEAKTREDKLAFIQAIPELKAGWEAYIRAEEEELIKFQAGMNDRISVLGKLTDSLQEMERKKARIETELAAERARKDKELESSRAARYKSTTADTDTKAQKVQKDALVDTAREQARVVQLTDAQIKAKQRELSAINETISALKEARDIVEEYQILTAENDEIAKKLGERNRLNRDISKDELFLEQNRSRLSADEIEAIENTITLLKGRRDLRVQELALEKAQIAEMSKSMQPIPVHFIVPKIGEIDTEAMQEQIGYVLKTFTDVNGKQYSLRVPIETNIGEVQTATDKWFATMNTVADLSSGFANLVDTFDGISDVIKNSIRGAVDLLGYLKDLKAAQVDFKASSAASGKSSDGILGVIGGVAGLAPALGAVTAVVGIIQSLIKSSRDRIEAEKRQAEENKKAHDELVKSLADNAQTISDSIKDLVRSRFGLNVTGESAQSARSAIGEFNATRAKAEADRASGLDLLQNGKSEADNLLGQSLIMSADLTVAAGVRKLLTDLEPLGVLPSEVIKAALDNLAKGMDASEVYNSFSSKLEQITNLTGGFANTLEGAIEYVRFFGDYMGGTAKEQVDQFLTRLIFRTDGISADLRGQLIKVLGSDDRKAALEEFKKALFNAAQTGDTAFLGGLSTQQIQDLISTLTGLTSGTDATASDGEYSKSVQIARSITEFQANEVVAELEQSNFYLREIMYNTARAVQGYIAQNVPNLTPNNLGTAQYLTGGDAISGNVQGANFVFNIDSGATFTASQISELVDQVSVQLRNELIRRQAGGSGVLGRSF